MRFFILWITNATNTNFDTDMHMDVCRYTQVYMYVCMCVRTYVCVCIYIYVCGHRQNFVVLCNCILLIIEIRSMSNGST